MRATDQAPQRWPRRALLAVLPALAAPRVAWTQKPIAREAGKNAMTTSIPASPSIILRATHIVFVRVESSAAGPWLTPPERWPERSVDLGLRIEEVLKGAIHPQMDTAIRVTQHANPGLINQAVPGVWSMVPVERGTELVIFATSETGVPANLVRLSTEPACVGVVPARSALPGVRLAMRRERGQVSTAEFLVEATGIAGMLDLVFGDYLKALLDQPEFAAMDVFERLMALVESRPLATQLRVMWLREIQYALSVLPIYGTAHRQRLVIALFRVALASSEPSIRQQILAATLPAVIGLHDGRANFTAGQVFHDRQQERTQTLERLKPWLNEEPAARLAAWLKQ